MAAKEIQSIIDVVNDSKVTQDDIAKNAKQAPVKVYEQCKDNQLIQLSKFTIVVADTGDLEAIKKHKPTDSTTNPSLVLKALNAFKSDDEKEYSNLVNLAVSYAKQKCDETAPLKTKLACAVDRLAVEFGRRILQVIPGYVSTELDARLSYDVQGSVQRALSVIALYEELGVKNPKERVLIKVASTWEGFQIAKILRVKHQIKCNMTLLFSIYQAAAAAQEAGAYLISPFVGRITDWNKKANNVESYDAFTEDPGVLSVRNIYAYYKMIKADTIVMGASFRNKEQVLALAGCDRLTIGPKWLQMLNDCNDKVERYLDDKSESPYKTKLDVTEPAFRYGMCEDACATEKLAEGIRKFAADIVKLEKILAPNF